MKEKKAKGSSKWHKKKQERERKNTERKTDAEKESEPERTGSVPVGYPICVLSL